MLIYPHKIKPEKAIESLYVLLYVWLVTFFLLQKNINNISILRLNMNITA